MCALRVIVWWRGDGGLQAGVELVLNLDQLNKEQGVISAVLVVGGAASSAPTGGGSGGGLSVAAAVGVATAVFVVTAAVLGGVRLVRGGCSKPVKVQTSPCDLVIQEKDSARNSSEQIILGDIARDFLRRRSSLQI